jgi:hypothetical protein
MKYLALIAAVLLLAGIGTLADYQQSKVPAVPTVSGDRAWDWSDCTVVKFSPPVVRLVLGLSEHSASSEMLRGVTVAFYDRFGDEEFSGTASLSHELKPGDFYAARSRVTGLKKAKAQSPAPGTIPNPTGWCWVQGINAVPKPR